MDQRISPLDDADRAQLDAQRARVLRYVADESRASIATVAGKLGLVRALLATGRFGRDHTAELQAMGLVLGDAMVQHLPDAEWVMVQDEYGRDPAVQVRGTSILLFPLTMISKRVEAGEQLDVFDLFDGLLDHVDRLR